MTIDISDMNLIKDPYFRVKRDIAASSPSPELGIWFAQHTCVTDVEQKNPPKYPGNAVIRHQLNKEHYSVLAFAFVSFSVSGFDHNTIMQFVRHHELAHLVQSQRYTGLRFWSSPTEIWQNLDKLVYIRPEGRYIDRNGNKFTETAESRLEKQKMAYDSLLNFKKRVDAGEPFESARSLLPTSFRQDYYIGGTLKTIFHCLDQRTKKNSQLEAQTLAWMLIREMSDWAPELIGWYVSNRSQKARLAP